MKNFIFRTIFTLNIIWGIIFFICSCLAHYAINNDGEYNCDVSYDSYQAEKSPTLFGSKAIAYYSAFCFLNPDDSGSETDSGLGLDADCGKGGGWQTILILPWFLLWAIPLYESQERNVWVVISTMISVLGIMFMYQALVMMKHIN